MGTKMKLIAAKARAFLRAKRGNVAVIFAVSIIPLVIAAGAGLDFARGMLVRQQITEALDAAALAVGSTPGLTLSTATPIAQKYFNANYTVDPTVFGTATVTVDSYDATAGTVTLSASANMPTVLIKLAGISTVPISGSSTVAWGQSKLWVALVLDNSGSMSAGDSSGSKMSALQNASHQLLTILQNASTNPGDVQVSIAPFTRSINMGESNYVSNAAMDWGEWDAPPLYPGSTTVLVQPGNIPLADTYAVPNVISSSPSTIVFAAWGPGDACPFTDASKSQMSPFGFNCVSSATNGASNLNTIASSGSAKGLICPGIDSGTYNTAHNARYYNGCYTSTKGTGTIVVATGSSAACKLGNGVGFSSSNCSCATVSGVKTCNTQRWVHSWVPNNHSTWSGCVMDRQRSGQQTMTTSGLRTAAATSYDTSNTQPSSGTPDSQFPTENPASCPAASITALGYNWTALGTQIDAMAPGGSTNQAIGVEHGWQMLTPGDPYATPAVPANTARYIILLSDGQNTQDRWWGDGSTEGTTADGNIDDREKATCDAAKADHVIIYTIFVNIGGGNSSAPLQYCASDSSKFFNLTTTSGVVTTFNQIGQQITNVRVSH